LNVANHIAEVADEKGVIGKCLGKMVDLSVFICNEAEVVVVLHEVALEKPFSDPE
jgi:hypothetical protein